MLRTHVMLLLVAFGISAGCSAPAPGGPGSPPTLVPVPVLFPQEGTYELKDGSLKTTGYVFAENDSKPGQQTLRWLLLETFKSPVEAPVYVVRMVQASDGATKVPTTAKEFADFARTQIGAGKRETYIKSHADTFLSMYDPPGKATRAIIPVPIPKGRPAPEPHGKLRPSDWDQASATGQQSMGSSQQIDGGSVGIRPGEPITNITGVGAVIGYLDVSVLGPYGVVGFGFASPQLCSNTEYLFLPELLFKTGLDHVTIEPFANTAKMPLAGPVMTQWVVVVVNSSYYPGYVPNDS